MIGNKVRRIDADPPDPAATRVQINDEVSSTTAIHARGALLKVVENLEPEDGETLWATWPIRRMIQVLDDALGDE